MRQQMAVSLPQVRKLKVPIIDVLFPSRSFVVLKQGYGKLVVRAADTIDFGTYARPMVFSGNLAVIEYSDSTGQWVASGYESSGRCVTNAPAVVRPLDTSTIFEPKRVDTNFNPHVGAMGQIMPQLSMPTQTLPPQSAPYDIGDGVLMTLAAASRTEGLYFLTVRDFYIHAEWVQATPPGSAYIELYTNGNETPAIIENTVLLPQPFRVVSGTVFRTVIVAGPSGSNGIAYGFQGQA